MAVSPASFMPLLLLFFFFPNFSYSCPSISACNSSIEMISTLCTDSTGHYCGNFTMNECGGSSPFIHIVGDVHAFLLKNISCADNTFVVQDRELSHLFTGSQCSFLFVFAPPILDFRQNYSSLRDSMRSLGCYPTEQSLYHDIFGKDYDLFYSVSTDQVDELQFPAKCHVSEPPQFEWVLSFSRVGGGGGDISLSLLSAGFSDDLSLYPECFTHSMKEEKRNLGIKIGAGIAAGALCLIILSFLGLLWHNLRKRKRCTSLGRLIRNGSSMVSHKNGLNLVSSPRTHVFTCEELEEATDGFSDARELGVGGFGTVYKGTLRDGSIVAVKRLYKNSYKGVEQFLNEVDILSRLRHQNLVTLYGCTSQSCLDLLLVYEFVPNGTLADHLHGPRATEQPLTWPIRMNIAIETADALNYLHAVEPQVIHRDVKTNNILLDDDFHVKVADFGLSRLFPPDATHISTAPQGTPGYVDPMYHQCYQLTDKSDVYSFGVVLVELISSKPAVDMKRSGGEINLANMAVNKIQSCEIDQLVDPELGYQSDDETKRMVDLLAELAFRCLQPEQDVRPPIKEVLGVLRGIQKGGNQGEKMEKDVCIKEDAQLLEKSKECSPDTVMHHWTSPSTTSDPSG